MIAAAILAGILLLAYIVSLPFYLREMADLKAELLANSRQIEPPYGAIEYVDVGAGTPVLISHATMGGYDQGLLQATAFLGDNFRYIIPSRFGYLQSGTPAEASFRMQADAFAYLLEEIHVEKVIVQGMSAGDRRSLQKRK